LTPQQVFDSKNAKIVRILAACNYLPVMPKNAFSPCIPTRGTDVPAGPDWIHEIKHDGYRLIVQREEKRVRLWTRNGHDWSDRSAGCARARVEAEQRAGREVISDIARGPKSANTCRSVRSYQVVSAQPL